MPVEQTSISPSRRMSSTSTSCHPALSRSGYLPRSSPLTVAWTDSRSRVEAEPVLEPVDRGRDGGDIGLGRGRRLGFEVDDDGSTGSESRLLYLRNVAGTLPLQGGVEVCTSQPFPPQGGLVVLAVGDDHGLGALEQ